METDRIEKLFEAHGVRPTAMRLLIWRAIDGRTNTFSLQDLETELVTVDKSTIFRTLTLFAEHHLLHEIEDGSGSRKYCVCHNDHECAPEEMHVHFYCEKCRRTFCIDNALIPPVILPEGFSATSAEYVIKGLCPRCR